MSAGFFRPVTIVAALALALGACTGKAGYFAAEDAPDHIKAGMPDFRLALTYAKGPPLSAFAEKLPHASGSFSTIAGLEPQVVALTRPLDVILLRSGNKFAKQLFPSEFTHSVLWLGTEAQLRKEGLWDQPELAPFRERIRAGYPIAEAAYRDVHLSPFAMTSDYERLAIFRSSELGLKTKRAAYARIAELEGTPFDPSFDVNDKTRLSCLEFLQEVVPGLDLPARYAQGRFAVIPDDAARLAITGQIPFRFVAHLTAEEDGPLQRVDAQGTFSLLSQPRAKPKHQVY